MAYRCEIDLSPGIRMEPVRPRAGLTVICIGPGCRFRPSSKGRRPCRQRMVEKILENLGSLVRVVLGHQQLDNINTGQDVGPEFVRYNARDTAFGQNALGKLSIQACGRTAECANSHKIHRFSFRQLRVSALPTARSRNTAIVLSVSSQRPFRCSRFRRDYDLIASSKGRRTSGREAMMSLRQRRAGFLAFAVGVLIFTPASLVPQQDSVPVPQTDTCTVDADGTAHVTRVVPVPGTISPE